ncbi:nuclear transport factor 2 family protein [Chryseobacterium sp.]|uniref:nuclear transport factor 2 family protein n=1 Tax=Chryseobacterium sp. TaxID=1871047 RepID=UPI00321A84BA
MSNTNQNVAEQFIQYLNDEDFDKAESCLDPEFKFIGVMGTREGASVYMKDMRQMKLKYQIIKTFTADEDVCFWYMIDMGNKTVEASGWYQISNGKIKSFKVLFDPRPLLNDQ